MNWFVSCSGWCLEISFCRIAAEGEDGAFVDLGTRVSVNLHTDGFAGIREEGWRVVVIEQV